MRAALERGALAAVALLGKADGFLGNPKVRIPLPGFLEDAAKLLKFTGQGHNARRVDHGHEPRCRSRGACGEGLVHQDGQGHERRRCAAKWCAAATTSVTDYFADKTRLPLGEKFLPIVTKVTAEGLVGRKLQRRGRQGGRASGW